MFRNLDASTLGVVGQQSEIIELALTYGFQGISLEIEESVYRAKANGVAYARRLFDSSGIRPGLFQLPMDLEAEDGVFQQKLGQLAEEGEVAAAMGCLRCVTRLVPASERLPYHENFEFHRRRLGEVCRVLEQFGLRLGIGFRAADERRRGKAFEFVHDLNALRLMVNMVGASNLGIVLDVWDLYVSSGAVEAVRGLSAAEIVAVDLADLPENVASSDASEAARLLPGATGRIDSPGVLAALAEKGYDGPVTPRPARVALGHATREGLVREAGEAMTRVWKAAGLAVGGKSPAAPRRG